MFKKFTLIFGLSLAALTIAPTVIPEGHEASAQRRGGYSRPSYSRPSYSRPSTPSRPSYSKPSTPSKSRPSYSKPSGSSSSVGRKPTSPNYGSSRSNAQKKVVSRQQMVKSQAPKTTFKSPTGKSVKIDPKSKNVSQLRSKMTQDKWKSRSTRKSTFYSSYSNRPVVVYNDPYGGYFQYWMLGQSVNNVALWMYHHNSVMAAERRAAMMAHYSAAERARLEAEIARLQASGVARNTAYIPNGMNDMDLMYNDSYVNAVYNPTAPPVPPSSGMGTFWIVLLVIFGLVGVGFVLWLIFGKDWS